MIVEIKKMLSIFLLIKSAEIKDRFHIQKKVRKLKFY